MDVEDKVLFASSYDNYDHHNDSSIVIGTSIDEQLSNLNSLNRSLQAELDESFSRPTTRSFDGYIRGLQDEEEDDERCIAGLLDLSTELGSLDLSPYSTATRRTNRSRDGNDRETYSGMINGSLSDDRRQRSDEDDSAPLWQSPLLSPLGIPSHDHSSDSQHSAFLSNSFIVQTLAANISPADVNNHHSSGSVDEDRQPEPVDVRTALFGSPNPPSNPHSLTHPDSPDTNPLHSNHFDIPGLSTEDQGPDAEFTAEARRQGSVDQASRQWAWAQVNYQEVDLPALLSLLERGAKADREHATAMATAPAGVVGDGDGLEGDFSWALQLSSVSGCCVITLPIPPLNDVIHLNYVIHFCHIPSYHRVSFRSPSTALSFTHTLHPSPHNPHPTPH